MSECREQSPVHDQDLPGHITRIVRAEEGNRAGDVLRLRRTARGILRCLMYTSRKSSVSYSEEPSGSFDMRVSTNPGATALTRMPRAARSTARHWVMLIKAALAELYASELDVPRNPFTDATFTTRPFRLFEIRQHLSDAGRGTHDIHVPDLARSGLAETLERHRVENRRIVDENIETAQLGLDRFRETPHRLGVGDIAWRGDKGAELVRSQPFSRIGQRPRIDVREHNPSALGQQSPAPPRSSMPRALPVTTARRPAKRPIGDITAFYLTR